MTVETMANSFPGFPQSRYCAKLREMGWRHGGAIDNYDIPGIMSVNYILLGFFNL